MVDLVLVVEADGAHAAGPAVGLGTRGGPLAVGGGLPADQVVPAVVLVVRPPTAAAAAAVVVAEPATIVVVVVALTPLTPGR